MRELEQVFRSGLAELAGEMETAAPVEERARSGADRRHRRRVRAVLAASGVAAAVLVSAALAAVVLGPGGPGPATSPTPPVVAPSVPGGYRLELWHGLAVHVPATWGWGSAPTKVGGGGAPVLCGGGVVQADGRRVESPDLPYVGRPIVLSDVCDAGWATARPRAPYVWLGGDVPRGTVDLGGGWVRESVQVDGSTVSVASDDPALRRAILGSAHVVTGVCDPRLDAHPGPGGTTAADFVPVAMTVCAYAADGIGMSYDLRAEEELGPGPAKALVAAVDGAAPAGSGSCFAARGGEWALLRVAGANGTSRDYVVDLACPSIADPTGTQHVLGQETVVPWAVGGVNAVLHGSPLIDAPGRLIPPLG